jgi:DNA-binding PadR family transcriptional regulator
MRPGWGFGFDPADWGFDWRKGRKGRRGQWFGSGDMKYVILKLLAKRPMHGYEVMKELEEETHGCYKPSPGTVYPTLQWLEDEGLVSAETVEGKKVYSITDAGRAFLETNKSTVEDIFERVTGTIEQLVSEPMPEVNRAMGKLVGQVYRTVWRLGNDDEKKRRIAEILERVTQEVEAL